MKPERRKFFIGGLIIIGIILYGLCGSIIQGLKSVGIQQASNPSFKCEIAGIRFGRSDENSSAKAVYFLRIVNSGSPSIAWKWKTKVKISDGPTIESNASEEPRYDIFHSTTSTNESTFGPQNYLPYALLESTLGSGSGKLGWVEFQFDTVNPEDLQRIGNVYTVQFEDSKGNITTSEFTISSKGSPY